MVHTAAKENKEETLIAAHDPERIRLKQKMFGQAFGGVGGVATLKELKTNNDYDVRLGFLDFMFPTSEIYTVVSFLEFNNWAYSADRSTLS